MWHSGTRRVSTATTFGAGPTSRITHNDFSSMMDRRRAAEAQTAEVVRFTTDHSRQKATLISEERVDGIRRVRRVQQQNEVG